MFSKSIYLRAWITTTEAVLRNIELSASIAAVFLDHDLGPEDEMAPVFRPVSAP